jgi:hypothetical protein
MRFDFLISSERSGSNLFTRILNSHSCVCAPPPSHMIRTFVRNRSNYACLEINHNWIAFTEDVSDLLKCQLGEWLTTLTALEIPKHANTRTLEGVVRAVYEAEANANGKNRLFIKENKGVTLVPFYLSSFSDCKLIHLVRDPRDVALSWKLSKNHPGAVMRAADVWHDEQDQVLMLSGCVHDNNVLMTLSYEDLLSNPEKTLKRVCSFLELDFENQMLEFHSQDQTVRNARRIKDWENLSKPLMKQNFNKYRKGLSESEIRWVENACRREMLFWGYQPDFETDTLPDSVEDEVRMMESEVIQNKHRYVLADETEIRSQRLKIIEKIINRIPLKV